MAQSRPAGRRRRGRRSHRQRGQRAGNAARNSPKRQTICLDEIRTMLWKRTPRTSSAHTSKRAASTLRPSTWRPSDSSARHFTLLGARVDGPLSFSELLRHRRHLPPAGSVGSAGDALPHGTTIVALEVSRRFTSRATRLTHVPHDAGRRRAEGLHHRRLHGHWDRWVPPPSRSSSPGCTRSSWSITKFQCVPPDFRRKLPIGCHCGGEPGRGVGGFDALC